MDETARLAPLTSGYQNISINDRNLKLLCSLSYLSGQEKDFNETLAEALDLLRSKKWEARSNGAPVEPRRVGRPPKVKS